MGTINMNRLNGPQRKILRETLLGVFRRRSLEIFLSDHDFETLENLVAPGSFKYQIHDLIEELSRVGHLDRLVVAVRTEFPDAPAIEDLSLRLGFVDTEADEQRVLGGEGLEKIVRAAGFEDLNLWTDRLSTAGQRICRISYDIGHAMVHGTGFLVSTNLVLTNYHVIEDVLHGRAEADRVRLSFGFAESPDGLAIGDKHWLAQDWLVAHAPYSAADLAGGSGVPKAAELDFAVLRLEKDAGEEVRADGKRGWFDLSDSSSPARRDAIVFVLQHPEGQPLKQSIGLLQESESPLRLRYDADTEPGSSGGLVLDQELRPIALHHSGDPRSKLRARYNQGIPLTLIHSALEDGSGRPSSWKTTVPEVGAFERETAVEAPSLVPGNSGTTTIPVPMPGGSTPALLTMDLPTELDTSDIDASVELLKVPVAATTVEKPPLLFYSCASEDEGLRAGLAKHIKLLERQRLLRTWHSGEVALGTESDSQIRQKLQEADIILLLVSPDYLFSDDLWGRDLEISLQRHQRREARVIPILLRTIEWETAPFSRLQPLPRDRRAIADRSKADRDRIFADIASAVREIATSIAAGRQS